MNSLNYKNIMVLSLYSRKNINFTWTLVRKKGDDPLVLLLTYA